MNKIHILFKGEWNENRITDVSLDFKPSLAVMVPRKGCWRPSVISRSWRTRKSWGAEGVCTGS